MFALAVGAILLWSELDMVLFMVYNGKLLILVGVNATVQNPDNCEYSYFLEGTH